MLLFQAIADKLGLSYALSPPSDGGLWGEEVAPGNFTGLVGDLQHGRWLCCVSRAFAIIFLYYFTEPMWASPTCS